MDYGKMKKAELIEEIQALRRRISEMKAQKAQHVQVERALQESEDMYSLLAENVSDVIWTTDAKMHYTFISPSVKHVRGYTAEEAMSQTPEEIFMPDSCEAVREIFKEELALGRSHKARGYRSRTLEVRLKCKDGPPLWAEIKLAPLPDKDGRPVGFLGITRNIDKRKRAEREKNRLYHRQQALLENVPAFIFLKDANMRYTAVNRAYHEMLPEGVEDPVGMRDRDFYAPGVAARFEAEDREVMEKGLTIKKEEPVRLRDGRVLHTAVTVTPVRNREGTITGLIGIAFDITERKQAEERLAHYAAELERTNNELETLMEEVRSLSLADELTGLYNRRGFFALAQQQLKIANRTKRDVSLFYFDLDDMKKINDLLGHGEGDSALKQAADVLRDTFRESDIIARIGGDEFVVMAVESPEIGAGTFDIRLNENLRVVNAQGKHKFNLSVSMGIAHYDPEIPCSVEDLLDRADKSMYEQKRARHKS